MSIGSNETTVVNGTIGGSIAFVLVTLISHMHWYALNTAETAGMVVAITAIFNYFIPKDVWYHVKEKLNA